MVMRPFAKLLQILITGQPNGSVLFCSLASVVCGRRLTSSVTLPAGGAAGRRAHKRSAAAGPGAWAVGRPTLHGGPVRLRLVKATPCYFCRRRRSCCDKRYVVSLSSLLLAPLYTVSIIFFECRE